MCMLSIIRRAKDPETRRMMVLNGTGLTIVLDTRQSSAVISDVIFNISHSVLRPSVSLSSKAPTFDSPPARKRKW
ncbi:hypothetical protein T09_4414 [Trichinella sp. T9]|uniref:Uncharacterized protein n=1 Tax=Trichinella murrelli TaxID=144512 RepID=A0A0V0T4P7_9BILA|nr:hypothetical protein T05_3899 [Trichinella murrelli]KRX65390.1 hypothetical protein T09_4414 [Trichinella sp. T9]